MKTIITAAFLLSMAVSQAQESEKRAVSDFSKIEVSSNIEVVYTESPSSSVVVFAQAGQLPKVVTEVIDKNLKIYTTSKSDKKIKVVVSGNHVGGFKLRDGASVKVTNGLTSEQANISLESDAAFEGQVLSDYVRVNATEGTFFNARIQSKSICGQFSKDAKVILTGYTGKARLQTEDSAYCTAKNFVSNDLVINAKHDSEVLAYSDSILSIEVNDRSKVVYKGSPIKLKLSEDAVSRRNKQNTVIALR